MFRISYVFSLHILFLLMTKGEKITNKYVNNVFLYFFIYIVYIVYLCIIAGGEKSNIFSVVVIIKKGENVGVKYFQRFLKTSFDDYN
jgi:hypothetical protein